MGDKVRWGADWWNKTRGRAGLMAVALQVQAGEEHRNYSRDRLVASRPKTSKQSGKKVQGEQGAGQG